MAHIKLGYTWTASSHRCKVLRPVPGRWTGSCLGLTLPCVGLESPGTTGVIYQGFSCSYWRSLQYKTSRLNISLGRLSTEDRCTGVSAVYVHRVDMLAHPLFKKMTGTSTLTAPSTALLCRGSTVVEHNKQQKSAGAKFLVVICVYESITQSSTLHAVPILSNAEGWALYLTLAAGYDVDYPTLGCFCHRRWILDWSAGISFFFPCPNCDIPFW